MADARQVPKNQLTEADKQETKIAYAEHGYNVSAIARVLGLSRNAARGRLVALGYRRDEEAPPEPFEVEDVLPEELPSAAELLERRKHDFNRKNKAVEARKLVNVKIKIDGPIGIAHFGDPHVDDDGCDIGQLERHIHCIQDTEGLFGANVGDMQNAWVGRLAHLYGQQSTSAAEAWVLVEWMVTAINWLYILKGNHDCWTGEGDPLDWMVKTQQGVLQAWGARLNLKFPGRNDGVRINARHDFSGHSMWSPIHGAAKAIQMGWRDHVLTCGHKHVSGYAVLKCPATGLISHALRVAGYKIHDRYAAERGLPDQNVSPTFVTIIRPEFADNDPRLIHTIFDVEEAAEYLTWLRRDL